MEIKKYIIRARKDEQQAFKFLLERYWNDIYRFQLSRINNLNEAEDITIETFAKAFEKIRQFKLESYQSEQDFKKWLLTISRNTYIDRYRKQKNTDKFVSLDQNEQYKKEKILNIPDDSSEEDELIYEQKLKEIQKALERLKPKYGEILKYRYFMGMSYQQIMEKTGESLSNVKVRLMRAKKLLAEEIKKK